MKLLYRIHLISKRTYELISSTEKKRLVVFLLVPYTLGSNSVEVIVGKVGFNDDLLDALCVCHDVNVIITFG